MVRAVALALIAAGCGNAKAEEPAGRLRVVAQVRPEAYYVGQSIELSVGVVAGREQPEVTMPKVAGADVTLVGTDLKPLTASGIGEAVFETNLFRTRYRLIPRRAGTLTIPPVPARLGERRGASEPLSIAVRNPPLVGRPAEFLGGVGGFEVEATAEPSSLRSGQTLEYRVTVRGPGARGITGAPSLARLERLPLGLRVEREPDQAVADPPSHTFVYRLRPTRAGEATLPPVSVAGFDPKDARYVTKVTPGVPIRVADVPRFDPSALEYDGPDVPDSGAGPWFAGNRGWAVVAGAVLLVGLGVGVVLGLRRASGVTRGVGRLCAGVAGRLDRGGCDAEVGRTVTEGLISYLSLTTGRSPGALTPAEAEQGVALATGSADLARRADRLITDCDRAQFDASLAPSPGATGCPPGPGQGDDLVANARRFFHDLADARVVGPVANGLPAGEAQGPRNGPREGA
jgi:hypothetical protein